MKPEGTCPVCLYNDLCALRVSWSIIHDRGLDNRLALQALRSAIADIQDEISEELAGLSRDALEDLLARVQTAYGESARFDFEDLAPIPASMVN